MPGSIAVGTDMTCRLDFGPGSKLATYGTTAAEVLAAVVVTMVAG
jgi:hypothetical protein